MCILNYSALDFHIRKRKKKRELEFQKKKKNVIIYLISFKNLETACLENNVG